MENRSLESRRSLISRRALIGAALGVVVLVIAGGVLYENLRPLAVRYAESRWHRSILVAGRFDVRLLTFHPAIVAERVTIGNPPWTRTGTAATIGRLELTFHLPWFGRSFGLETINLAGATLTLFRDTRGRANWQAVDPAAAQGGGPPLIRGLSLPDAAVHLVDERRHLKFDGIVSTLPEDGSRLRFIAKGQLNGRLAELNLTGDPLPDARRNQPYRFDYAAHSVGSRLTGQGSLASPFDFAVLQTSFEATGPDMKDLYFLTGVSLPDTGAYRLRGRFARNGDHLEFDGLQATSGESDLLANIAIEAHLDSPSHIEADLSSRRLRLSDLGKRAAGRAPVPESGQLVLPVEPFRLAGSRDTDAVIRFRAHRLDAGRARFHEARARVRIDHGLIDASPVEAALEEGNITGRISIDARRRLPSVTADVRVSRLGLDQFHTEGHPGVLEGAVNARITLQGTGDSLHAIASGGNGKFTAILPQGAVRASVAEMAGLDLNALGLLATQSQRETTIRCGVADFDLNSGVLSARTLVLDTEPVLITGEGMIALDSESLDLRLAGRPKHPRLRVRAPVLIRGTLHQPSFGVQARNTLAQAAGAIALGTLLTPAAALLAFVDPGLAKNQDCAALLAREQGPLDRSGSQRRPPPSP